MRLRFVNPNTTASMTAKVLAAARDAAPEGVAIEAVTSRRGPAAIQGEADGRAALPGLLDEVDRAVRDGVDVLAIACFDDTGIAESRARAGGALPVLGLCQSAALACLARGHRFSVVTTLAVSIPVIEANLAVAGLAAGCARVRASGVPVLALEAAGGDAEARVAPRSSARSPRTTSARSCSAAPAWRTWPNGSDAASACRSSTGWPPPHGSRRSSRGQASGLRRTEP